MYRVLIVDDEKLIREGLSRVIDWEGAGFTVVGLAQDYEDALLAWERLKPDILVTDIRMPGPDGLSLIETLKDMDPLLRVLVLSGHADFDYAKRALRARVDGYLLKPVDEEELLGYLRDIKVQLDAAAPRIDPRTLLETLAAGSTVPGPAFQGALETGLFGAGPWQVLILQAGDTNAVPQLIPANKLSALESYLSQEHRGRFFLASGWGAILLFTPWTAPAALESLHRELSQILAPPLIRMAMSLVFNQLSHLPQALAEARLLLCRAFFSEPDHIMVPHRPDLDGQDQVAIKDLQGLAQELAFQLDARNSKDFEAGLDQYCRILGASACDEGSFKASMMSLGSLLLERWGGLHPDNKEERDAASVSLAELYQLGSARELTERFKLEIQGLWYRTGPGGSSQVAERLEAMIQSHFAEQLHLDELARAFGYNSAYLGKLFKSKTGISFNTRLDEVRITKARNLLAEGFKVNQVARMVGYRDPEYFLEKFKKVMGMSPRAWKNQDNGDPCRGPGS